MTFAENAENVSDAASNKDHHQYVTSMLRAAQTFVDKTSGVAPPDPPVSFKGKQISGLVTILYLEDHGVMVCSHHASSKKMFNGILALLELMQSEWQVNPQLLGLLTADISMKLLGESL